MEGGIMGTRACVLFGNRGENSWRVYYRHNDGYPRALGLELAEAIKRGLSKDEIIKRLSLEDYHTFVCSPEEPFTKIQGDLEWIYAVILNEGEIDWSSLRIYRTSNPRVDVDFVFLVWGSYAKLFPEDLMAAMENIELTAEVALNAVAAYHLANQK